MLPDEMNPEAVDFDDSAEDESGIDESPRFAEAVIHATDWTTETIVGQMLRNNIGLRPRFQRRDAWRPRHKSRFIESLILGLPIPPIVLAENKEHKGRFIVLDGKQRLLALLQYWGNGEGANNAYALSGLQIRKELNRVTFAKLSSDGRFDAHYNSLLNQPIRTVVIKNWPDTDFLHLVFLRLNTGSVKLSPQELRQAIVPGEFTDWIDDAAIGSTGLRKLLRLSEPDARMRDVELLARHLSFALFLEQYHGRMKEFLDTVFAKMNRGWGDYQAICMRELEQFELGLAALDDLFACEIARKPGGRLFNRAVFDALSFFARHAEVRQVMREHADQLRQEYRRLFNDADFVAAVERDTAGVPNTINRIAKWGEIINRIGTLNLPIPRLVDDGGDQRIARGGE